MFDLSGRIAMVTGAATGLGQAVATALAEAGADVAASDRPGHSLEATADAIASHGRRALPHELDVRDLGAIEREVALVEARLGPVDIIVSNAGINRPARGLDVRAEEWDDHFATNVRGGFFLAQAAARGMIERGRGRIVFISSQSGLVGIPGQPVYCATKGAIIQLVRTLGVEWAPFGITVNSVAPTFVETDMTRRRLQDPVFREFVLGKIPVGRLGEPSEIGAAVVYLASDEAAMVNATTLSVDGGWTAW